MSFRNYGRKLRPEFGKLLSNSAAKLAAAEDFDFTAVIAETLRETFGGTAVSIKTVRDTLALVNARSGIGLRVRMARMAAIWPNLLAILTRCWKCFC